MKKNTHKAKFDRNAAFSMNLYSSDDEGAIQSMMSLDGELICFSEKSIKEVLTSDTIDPEKENPETRHSYQTIYDIGTENSLVARTIIQSKGILDSLILRQGLNKQMILDHVWACSKLLIKCEESYYNIFSQTTELMHICDTIINKHNRSSYIPQLPQVKDLEQSVVSFLCNAKRFLETSHEFFSIFYDSPHFDSNFKSYRDWMAKNKPNCKEITKLLEQDKDWIQLIAWSRNALDVNHSQSNFKLIINNFKLQKGNKFTNPSWYYNFTAKKGGMQKEPSDIIRDMSIHIHNMVIFFEEIFLLCIKDNWDSRYNFQIYKREENEISKKCPSVYFVSFT